MTDYVLAGLTKRRAELAGEAETLRARLAQIATDTGHLDAVIQQFDPDYDLGSIRPKRPRMQDAAGRRGPPAREADHEARGYGVQSAEGDRNGAGDPGAGPVTLWEVAG